MNWADDRADYYYQGINAGGALVSVTGTRREEARRILQNAGGDLRESGFETVAGRASADVKATAASNCAARFSAPTKTAYNGARCGCAKT